MVIVGGLTVGGLLAGNPWLRLGLLELATFLTVVRVWLTARTRAAKFTYLAVVLVSAICALGSEALLGLQGQGWSRALLLTGILVKLAAIPMLFWLLSLADELPALVLGLIIAVVDMAAFGEYTIAAQSLPGVLMPPGLLLGAAAATSLVAAILMLSQRSLKRLLVLSTIEDAGFLLLGVASATQLGLEGAVVAACTHSVAKTLLFACLSAPERAGELEAAPVALATRYPVSAFGFLFGMLAMLGVPPLLGFVGRWRLYETALEIGWPMAATFILSSILALIAYVLALARFWWGPPRGKEPPDPKANREPFLLQATIVGLTMLLVLAGIWPGLLQMLQGGR
jgi:multicomponent Na+:H+ antiporter subunit D